MLFYKALPAASYRKVLFDGAIRAFIRGPVAPRFHAGPLLFLILVKCIFLTACLGIKPHFFHADTPKVIVTLMRHGQDGRILYYTIHDRQPSLSAPYALTTAYRVGSGRERERHYDFEDISEMDEAIRFLLARRIKDGYRLLYSWSRDARWTDPRVAIADPVAPTGRPGLLSRASVAYVREARRS
ncbi:MAG: hypothetical protein ACOYM2_12090 [Rectinemataceae bacterium]